MTKETLFVSFTRGNIRSLDQEMRGHLVVRRILLCSRDTICSVSYVETGVFRRDIDISDVLFCGEMYLQCTFLRSDRLEFFGRIQGDLRMFS